jgi:phospholipid transport system substrate-binding protein
MTDPKPELALQGDRRQMTNTFTRRGAIALAGAAIAVLAAPARAASVEDAVSFVGAVVTEIETLVKSGRPIDVQVTQFRKIFADRAASQQAARFVMGVAWRDMTEDQQSRLHDAFLDHVARVYVDLLGQYKGQTIEVTDGVDFGKKGILVRSVAHGPGVDDVAVEWLASDRGGSGLKLVDIIIEGLSMLQSQRQDFAARLERRGGDVDRLITDLSVG